MNMKERITKARIVALCFAGLLPLAAVGLGILFLIANTLINTAFVLGFILLPLVALLLLAFLIFSQMKAGKKTAYVIFLLILFVFAFIAINIFGKFEMLDSYKNGHVAEKYAEVAADFDPMPSLTEIGQPENIEYCDYFSSQGLIFTCDADALICKYSEAEYEDQKALLEGKYIFQSEPMRGYKYSCEPAVQIDGYYFRTLSISDYGQEIYFPKRLVFIATNDEAQEIVYMAFYDDDLDYIESLTDFINEDCGWKHMR